MKRSRRVGIAVVLGVCAVLCGGCAEKDNDTVKIFGPEIYNASYVSVSDNVVRHIIPMMSEIDLTEICSVEVAYEGGTAEYDYLIEAADYKIESYSLYDLALDFSDIEINGERITIKEISMKNSEGEIYKITPDKCEIVSFEGELNVEPIDINGSPLKLPADMQEIPMELSSNETVIIKDIVLTNTDLKYSSFKNPNGTVTEEFKEFSLVKDAPIKTWVGVFDIGSDELSKYKQYGTSVIVVYECDGKEYYTIPAISTTLYNPFHPNYDGIEKYYEKIIGENR